MTKIFPVLLMSILTLSLPTSPSARGDASDCSLSTLKKSIQYLERREAAAQKGLETWKNSDALKVNAQEIKNAGQYFNKITGLAVMGAGGAYTLAGMPVVGVGTVVSGIEQFRHSEPKPQPIELKSRSVARFQDLDNLHRAIHDDVTNHTEFRGSLSEKMIVGFVQFTENAGRKLHPSKKAGPARDVAADLPTFTMSQQERYYFEAVMHAELYKEELALIKNLKTKFKEAMAAGSCEPISGTAAVITSTKKGVPPIIEFDYSIKARSPTTSGHLK